MSIEDALLKIAEAVTIHAKAISQMSQASGSGAGKEPAKGETKSTGKPANKPASSRRRAPAKVTAKALKDKGQAFLDAVEDDGLYHARREFLKDLAADFEAAKFSEIPEDKRAEALEKLENYKDPSEGGNERDADEDI